MSQVEYYELAPYYELINEQAVNYDRHVAFLRRAFAPLGPQPLLLDIACGPGLHGRRLSEVGATVVGIDLSLPLLRIGRRREARWGPFGRAPLTQPSPSGRGLGEGSTGALVLLCADMRALPFVRVFDGAYCLLHSINYLTSGADLSAALRSVRGALRPGGMYVVDFLDYGPPQEWEGQWTEDYRGDGSRAPLSVRIRAHHHQTLCPGGRSAVDRHQYTIWSRRGKWEVEGEDRLRVTSAADMAQRIAAAGFEVLRTLNAYSGDKPGANGEAIVVARRPFGRLRTALAARRPP